MKKVINYIYLTIDILSPLLLFFNISTPFIFCLFNSFVGIISCIINFKDFKEYVYWNKYFLIPVFVLSLFMLSLGIKGLADKAFLWFNILLIFYSFTQFLWVIEVLRHLYEYHNTLLKLYICLVYPIRLFIYICLILSCILPV